MAPDQGIDHDKTSIMLEPSQSGSEDVLPFAAVAVAPGRAAPRNAPYIAQQTSLDDFTPGLNPLVNAASQLILEIVRLRTAREADIETLRARLESEVRGFNAQAVAMGISEAQVNAAQYLLCTALDECVTSSAIPGAQGEWQHKSLLSTFHQETWGGERFFEVLDRTMTQPAARLYLLELIYLLLSLGFEGKFRLMDRGALELESKRDQLFRQIRILRGETSPDLSKKLSANTQKQRIFTYIPAWLIGSVVVFCLAVTWWGFSHALGSKAKPLMSKYESQASTGAPYTMKAPENQPETRTKPQPEPEDEPAQPATEPASTPEVPQ